MASGIIWTPEERVIQPATPAPFDRRFSLGVWVPGAYGMALNTGAQLSPSATPVVSQGLRAARFNGTSDYQVTGWSGTPSVFSWVVVFKAELAPTTETSEAVVHRDGSSLTWGHGSPAYRGVVTFNSSGTYPKVALLDTTPGVWHTVVCVADGAQIRVWQNGRYCGSDTASGAITAGTWNFGRDAGAINATNYWAGDIALCALSPLAITDGQKISRNPWQLFEADNDPVFYSLGGGGATDYPVTATDALTLADSASQSFAATVVAAEAMTLADSASNVAALGASGTAALTLADSASNVAALSATATDALTLADTLNATASGDYTATGSDALTLADSASNVAALGATGSDALTLADAASNVAALGATASDALTLADTLNASASGDYVVVATDALSLSDSVVAAYAAICIATDALTLADATSAAMAGEYAATATDALTLADATSNAAALGVSISEALTLAALVSAMLTGNTALTGKRGGYGVQMQLAARRAQIQTGRRRN